MGTPKQPGQDADAHRELAERHLVALQELEQLRTHNVAMATTLHEIANRTLVRFSAALTPKPEETSDRRARDRYHLGIYVHYATDEQLDAMLKASGAHPLKLAQTMSSAPTRWGTNTGHGHVWKRPDGVTARCGGPGLCAVCSLDAAREKPPPFRTPMERALGQDAEGRNSG